jgi:hypothetical protein
MSAVPPTAARKRTPPEVRVGPTADVIKEATNCGGLTKAVSGLC